MKNYDQEPKESWTVFWIVVAAICAGIVLFGVALGEYWIKLGDLM